MVLQNLAWSENFFWDGRSLTLEEQILITITDSIEMDETWSNFLSEINMTTIIANFFIKLLEFLNLIQPMQQKLWHSL